MASSATRSPLSNRLFVTLWVGSLCSHFGNAVQAVGASWLMTSLHEPADMVALVQTATSLPILFFSLLGGAAADLHDKRKVMLAAQCGMCALSVLLALLAGQGLASPWLLLALTFALGSGVAMFNPALQAGLGDIVPREQLASALSLNVLGFNTARSLGPAIGGAIVAAAGSSAAFVVNAVSYLGAILMLSVWKGTPRHHDPAAARRIGEAIVEGLRFAGTSAPIRTVLIRAMLFTSAGASAWGLMPLVARDLVGGGAAQFGILQGGLGLGAVIGALISARLRKRFSAEAIIRMAGIGYGAALLVVASRPGLWPSFAALTVGGIGWVQALAGFSITGQAWSPRPIVGRVAAIVNMTTFGGIALGSWLWGHAADAFGMAPAIAASGAAMLLLPLVGLVAPLPSNEGAA